MAEPYFAKTAISTGAVIVFVTLGIWVFTGLGRRAPDCGGSKRSAKETGGGTGHVYRDGSQEGGKVDWELDGAPRRGTGSTYHDGVARRVVVLSLCAAIAAMLQAMPVVFPGLGMMLAVLSTLPICLGTLLYPSGALALVMVTTGILTLVHVEEAAVFILTTGTLGVNLAWAVSAGPSPVERLVVPGLSLAGGIAVLSFVIGLPALGPGVSALSPGLAVVVYAIFGLGYSWLWLAILSRNRRRLADLLGLARARMPW